MRVDFPAPFSPMSACTSPARSERSAPSRASTPGNRIVMPRIWTIGRLSVSACISVRPCLEGESPPEARAWVAPAEWLADLSVLPAGSVGPRVDHLGGVLLGEGLVDRVVLLLDRVAGEDLLDEAGGGVAQ